MVCNSMIDMVRGNDGAKTMINLAAAVYDSKGGTMSRSEHLLDTVVLFLSKICSPGT